MQTKHTPSFFSLFILQSYFNKILEFTNHLADEMFINTSGAYKSYMRRSLIVFIVLLVSVSNTLALGIAYEYMNDNTITVPQGNERIFRLTLQNDQDTQVSVKVVVDSEIATLRGKSDYTISAKNYDTPVDILIKVPSDAPINSSYGVHYVITPTADKSTGQVPFSVRYDRGFSVIVGKPAKQVPILAEPVIEQPAITTPIVEQKTTSIGVTLILIICIIAILGLVWQSSKKISKKMMKSAKQDSTQNITQNSTQTTTDSSNTNTITTTTTKQTPSMESNEPTIMESSTHIPVQNKEQIIIPTIPNEYLAVQQNEQINREIQHNTTSNKTERISRINELKEEVNAAFSKRLYIQKPQLPKAAEEQRFFIVNGPAIEDLIQLQTAIDKMNDEQYQHHVHDNTNDFAAWTQGVFGLNDLAQKMRTANNKNELLEVLENEL